MRCVRTEYVSVAIKYTCALSNNKENREYIIHKEPFLSLSDSYIYGKQLLKKVYDAILDGRITFDIENFNPKLVYEDRNYSSIEYITGKDESITLANYASLSIEYYDDRSICIDDDCYLSMLDGKWYLVDTIIPEDDGDFNCFSKVVMEFKTLDVQEIIYQSILYVINTKYLLEKEIEF